MKIYEPKEAQKGDYLQIINRLTINALCAIMVVTYYVRVSKIDTGIL